MPEFDAGAARGTSPELHTDLASSASSLTDVAVNGFKCNGPLEIHNSFAGGEDPSTTLHAAVIYVSLRQPMFSVTVPPLAIHITAQFQLKASHAYQVLYGVISDNCGEPVLFATGFAVQEWCNDWSNDLLKQTLDLLQFNIYTNGAMGLFSVVQLPMQKNVEIFKGCPLHEGFVLLAQCDKREEVQNPRQGGTM